MVDLLREHHENGRRFEPIEFVEDGPRVVVRMKVSDPSWPGTGTGTGETYKVFTFGASGDDAVLLQDCRDRADALAYLAPA